MEIVDGGFLLEKQLQKRNPVLMTNFKNIALVMYHTLEKIRSVFYDFTDHAGRHALIVTDFMDRLIGPENIERLNDDEIYLLLCAAYLHDFGMTLDEPTFARLREGIVREDYFTVHPEATMRDAIRSYHQLFSEKLILEMAPFFEFATPEHAFCVARISAGHRHADLFDSDLFPPEYTLPNGNVVHLPYLAALIRLADELDIAIDRNPIYMYDLFADVPAYREHFAVKHLAMYETEFVEQIETDDPVVRETCLHAGRKLGDTLQYCINAIEQLTPFTIRQQKLTVMLNGERLESKTKISVLDTDVGTDDAMALALLPLLGEKKPDYIVLSPGNASLSQGLLNIALLEKMFGLNIPVVLGVERDVVLNADEKGTFHGEDGLANAGAAWMKKYRVPEEAARVYLPFETWKQRLATVDEITYTTIGPVKNLALLLNDPAIAPRIRHAYIMGGGLTEYNCAGHTEFNFSKSPESVRTVWKSAVPITLFPLDFTNHRRLDAAQLSQWEQDGILPEALTLLRFNLAANARYNGIDAAVMHDAMPILYQLDAAKFTSCEKTLLTDDVGRTYEAADGRPVTVVTDTDDAWFRATLSRALKQ